MQGGRHLPSGAGIHSAIAGPQHSRHPLDRTNNFIVNSLMNCHSEKQTVHQHGDRRCGPGRMDPQWSFRPPFRIAVRCLPPPAHRAIAQGQHAASESGKRSCGEGQSAPEGCSGAMFDPRHSPQCRRPNLESSYNCLRGPGATDFDASVFRDFQIWKRPSMQFRAEALTSPRHPISPIPVPASRPRAYRVNE